MPRRPISSIGVITLVAVLAGSAQAAVIRYAWTGRMEMLGDENPWGLSGDGSAQTRDDGTPFAIEVFLDEAAVDEDEGQVGGAEFQADGATLSIGGAEATMTSVEILFSDDVFGTIDTIDVVAEAELDSTSLFISFGLRLPLSTFSFASTAGQEPPPLFADTVPIEIGGALDGELFTYPDEAPVTATLPEPGGALAPLGALLLLARGWRRPPLC
jgi:hypothetical protein